MFRSSRKLTERKLNFLLYRCNISAKEYNFICPFFMYYVRTHLELTLRLQFPRMHAGCNISNTRSVSSGYPNTEKRVENTTRSGVFLTKFEVFG